MALPNKIFTPSVINLVKITQKVGAFENSHSMWPTFPKSSTGGVWILNGFIQYLDKFTSQLVDAYDNVRAYFPWKLTALLLNVTAIYYAYCSSLPTCANHFHKKCIIFLFFFLICGPLKNGVMWWLEWPCRNILMKCCQTFFSISLWYVIEWDLQTVEHKWSCQAFSCKPKAAANLTLIYPPHFMYWKYQSGVNHIYEG